MDVLELPARELRLPVDELDALAADAVAAVTRYGRRRWYLLSDDQFALVAPLLELLLAQGGPVSPELQMTREDLALARDLADDDEPYPAALDDVLPTG